MATNSFVLHIIRVVVFYYQTTTISWQDGTGRHHKSQAMKSTSHSLLWV